MPEDSLIDEAAFASAGDAAGSGDPYSKLGDPNAEFKMPSVDEVWKLIESMEGISDEERASIRENLYNPTEGTAEDFMKRFAQPEISHSSWDYMIFFAMIALVVLVFAYRAAALIPLFRILAYRAIIVRDIEYFIDGR